MEIETFVRDRVQMYFVDGDDNCAMSSLKILGDYFEITIAPQAVAAAQCMPGVGGTGAACGLVLGVLMFIGVWGAEYECARETLYPLAQRVIDHVQLQFGSVCCRDLQRERGCGSLAVEMLSALLPVLVDELAGLQEKGG